MKRMRRLLSMLLVCCMVFSLVPVTAMAVSDTDVAYAVEGGNIYFDTSTGTITDCDSSVTSADIPSNIQGVPVKAIGVCAFQSCTSLSSVTIPDSVTSIGDQVFYGCSSLTSVTIPNSVTSIGKYAFYECSILTSITIPNSVASIGSRAFTGCRSLTSVVIPDSVTSIGSMVFSGCTGLREVTISLSTKWMASRISFTAGVWNPQTRSR